MAASPTKFQIGDFVLGGPSIMDGLCTCVPCTGLRSGEAIRIVRIEWDSYATRDKIYLEGSEALNSYSAHDLILYKKSNPDWQV